MSRVLIDTGPLVALVDRSEKHHEWVRDQLASLRPPLLTCEPVIAEAVYLLRRARLDGGVVLELLERGAIRTPFTLEREAPALGALIRKYHPRMDLADACLVRMTELLPGARILTFDSDFLVYRRNGRQVVPTIRP